MTDRSSWKEGRERLKRTIESLEEQGICYSCQDLQTGEVFGEQQVVYEDDLFKVALDPYPRAKGHTIVVFKPHREDVSALSDEEASRVFQMCVRVIKAIKKALGAEKVYLYTMCDGKVNHLHVQLLPRYAGDPMGSKRFVAERQALKDGGNTARLIRSALHTEMGGVKEA